MGKGERSCGRAEVTADQIEAFEERAAILEFDAGMSREDAEKAALEMARGNGASLASAECQQDAS